MATEEEPCGDGWVFVGDEEEITAESLQESSTITDSSTCNENQEQEEIEETVEDEETAIEEACEIPHDEIATPEDLPEINDTHEESPELLDHESDSFSVISSLSDNFSYLSWYDNVMEDIIISSGKRCYAHFRNKKLNTSLNSILTVAFTLVAGLAIGNLIGLTKNCEYEKIKVVRNCVVNSSVIASDNVHTDMPIAASCLIQEEVPSMVLEKLESMPIKLIEKSFDANIPSHFTLFTLALKGKSSDHLLTAGNANEDEGMIEDDAGSSNGEVLKTPFSFFNAQWTLNSVINEDCNKTEHNDNSDMQNTFNEELPNLQLLQSSIDIENLEPSTLITYLHNTVDDMMHRAIQLTLNLPAADNSRSRGDFVNVERTRNAIHKFIGLAKKTLDNLSKSMQSTDSKSKSSDYNNKYFFRVTSGIIKSIDKLMKGVFKEVLAKKDAAELRLRKIQGLFFDVMKKLEKNLGKDEKRGFDYERKHSKKPDFYHGKNKDHESDSYQKQLRNQYSDKNYKKGKPYVRNWAD